MYGFFPRNVPYSQYREYNPNLEGVILWQKPTKHVDNKLVSMTTVTCMNE